MTLPVRIPRHAGARPRIGWAGAAVALAAGLGIAAYVVPQRQAGQVQTGQIQTGPIETGKIVAAAPPPSAPGISQSTTAANPPPGTPRRETAIAARPVRNTVRRASRTVQEIGDFVALDDQPFESGVIMRVAVTPGKTQADIVFGPDGRARAFRLVKAPRQNF